MEERQNNRLSTASCVVGIVMAAVGALGLLVHGPDDGRYVHLSHIKIEIKIAAVFLGGLLLILIGVMSRALNRR